MAGQGGIRAGRAFIEVFLDSTKVQAGLKRIGSRFQSAGAAFAKVGGVMAGGAAAIGAPLVASLAAGAKFQDVMLDIKASTGATSEELDRLRTAAMGAKIGPTAAAESFLELLKAGMSVEDVLSGAGQAAIAFGKVGKMEAGEAAVIMADSMKVFGTSADTAANTISAAADASSTDIAGMAQAFSQVSAVAGLADQSIESTAAALAVLANAGVKGSDAGTSLKTMLLRLMAPTDDAAEAMSEVGLSTEILRDSSGDMLPLVEIIGKIDAATAGLSETAKDSALRRIFGTDAIRAAAILTSSGVSGFAAMTSGMANALPVGKKLDMMMDGLSGTKNKVLASAERLAIGISEALTPAIVAIGKYITGPVDLLAKFAAANGDFVRAIAIGVVAVGAFGGALLGTGLALNFIGFAFTGLASGVGILASLAGMIPALLVIGGIAAGVASLAYYFGNLNTAGSVTTGILSTLGEWFSWLLTPLHNLGAYIGGELTALWSSLSEIAQTTIAGIQTAIANGDWAAAGEIAMAGLKAVWAAGLASLITMWEDFKLALIEAFAGAVIAIQKMWTDLQGKIAKTIIDQAGQEGPLGAAARAILGVDMRKENARGAALDAALGISGPSASDQAKALVDQMTSATQDAFASEGFGGRMLAMADTAKQMRDEAVARAQANADATKATVEGTSQKEIEEKNLRDAFAWTKSGFAKAQEIGQNVLGGVNDWFGLTPGEEGKGPAGQMSLGFGAVGGFDVAAVQAGFGPSLYDETKKQTRHLAAIERNTEDDEEYGA